MKILVATEDKPYFIWQILVQLNNFTKFGYDKDTIFVVASNIVSPELQKLINSKRATIYVYSDTREHPSYLSSVRPHILEKFYTEHVEIANEPIFYIDPDILFVRKIDFEPMLVDDAWHCSNSTSYVGFDYLRKNSCPLLVAQMCDVVGFNSKMIEDVPAGGAQYLMKGITAEFWAKCYKDMEAMYTLLSTSKIVHNKPMLVNSWCADMWAVLWNSIIVGRKIIIEPSLSFSWATDDIQKWELHNIYHNAGSVKKKPGFFVKGDFYNQSPFGKKIEVANTNCSYNYLQAIRDTENNYKELIF